MFEKYLTLKNFPLYYGPLGEVILKDLPSKIDLEIGLDTNYDIIRLNINEELTTLLDKTYSLGSNPSVPLGKGEIQSRVMHSVLQELETLSKNQVDYKVVEVGCGEGHLLNNLGKLGWTVKGYEISPIAKKAREEFNIDIVQDYFTYKDGSKYNLIFSYNVLEHIINLEEFILQGYKSLEENGIFCHIVPDCEHMLKQGNLRVLSHQHVNYFTSESLRSLFTKFGFSDVQAKTITPGNGLMVFCYKQSFNKTNQIRCLPNHSKQLVTTFSTKLSDSLRKLESYLNELLKENKTVAFYAGGMSEYILLNRKEKILFINSDPMMHDKKIFYNLSPISSPTILLTYQPDVIIVFASNYFTEIAKYLKNELQIRPPTKIISIDEVIF